MNGEQTSNETKNETSKPHRINPHRVTGRFKKAGRRLASEKLVRLSNEWGYDRRKYSRLDYILTPSLSYAQK